MERRKRPFYIIGNNPNTIEEAQEFLENGANALEPDVVFAEGQFYISHTPQLSYDDVPTLQTYLQQLKILLLERQYNLALIIWDIKTTNFNPDHFIDLVKQNFSGDPFDKVAMLITNDDDHAFLNQYSGGYPNVGIGVDESNITPAKLESIFRQAGQQNFSYADGITTLLSKTGVYENVTEAIDCRNKSGSRSFGVIYTWVVSRKSSMHKYLDVYIDGIMIDAANATVLKKLVTSAPYNEAYEIAQNGYNPFTNLPIPQYKLSIETKDQFLAGTDAQVLFKLTGENGDTLESLPFNAGLSGALERGSVYSLVMEGLDIGEIKSLGIEMLSGGIGSGWLPEKITVESTLLKDKITFEFNGSTEEWITNKSGRLTKYPVV